MKLEPGCRIGDYEILSQLGAGGMGRVYKVRNELSDRLEAMKVLLPDLEGQVDLANRFLREIKVQAGLDHPHIAKLYTASRIENQLLMFMELVEGITLDERLKQGPIPLSSALDYIKQVLSALDYAHQRGVVHRDIKPANMMLLPDGKTVKLLDFGIAKAAADTRLTMTGTTLGSLYYMSPEQIQGAGVDVRSDLYSVGVSLYEMVTGKKPFDGESQFAIMSAHLVQSPVPPVEVNAALPAAVSEIILMALSKDPGARFQTAAAFLNALRNVATDTAASPVVDAPRAPVIAVPSSHATAPVAPAPAPVVTPPPPPPTLAMPVAAPTPFKDSVAGVTAAPPAAPPQAAVRAPAQQFHLIEPTAVATRKSGPKRLVWVAVGGLCAALAIVAFIQFGPRIKTSAKETSLPEHKTTAVAQPPNLSTPPVAPESPITATPDKLPPAEHSLTMPAPASDKPVAIPEFLKKKTERAQVQPRNPAREPQEVPPQPPPTRAQPEPPPQPSQQKSELDTKLPPEVNKNRMAVQHLSEELDQLVVRASAVRVALTDLQRAQASQGLGLRSDWVEAFNSMNNFLRKANQAINDADAEAARTNMAKAQRQIELLEKGLGR